MDSSAQLFRLLDWTAVYCIDIPGHKRSSIEEEQDKPVKKLANHLNQQHKKTLPQLSSRVAEYRELPEIMTEATRSIRLFISLGETFLTEGISDIHVDATIFPKIKEMVPAGIWPRVLPGYATLLWFNEKVLFCSVTLRSLTCTLFKYTHSV